MEPVVHPGIRSPSLLARGKISVVIPVFKSERSLPVLVPRLIAALKEMRRDFEIILVDDCSPDLTWQRLKQLRGEHGSALRLAKLLKNSGQHNAILCGLSLVTGEVVVTMDDDLQNPPEEVPKLVEAIDRGFDLAVGAYDSKKHSGPRNAGGRFIDWLQRRIFGLPRDFQLTSFRAFRRVVADNVCQMGVCSRTLPPWSSRMPRSVDRQLATAADRNPVRQAFSGP